MGLEDIVKTACAAAERAGFDLGEAFMDRRVAFALIAVV